MRKPSSDTTGPDVKNPFYKPSPSAKAAEAHYQGNRGHIDLSDPAVWANATAPGDAGYYKSADAGGRLVPYRKGKRLNLSNPETWENARAAEKANPHNLPEDTLVLRSLAGVLLGQRNAVNLGVLQRYLDETDPKGGL